jgi:hypothetical protein
VDIGAHIVIANNKMLAALGAIALTAIAAPDEAEAHYQQQCDWLNQQSTDVVEQFLKANPDHPCAEVAAMLVVERTTPASGQSTPAPGSRY